MKTTDWKSANALAKELGVTTNYIYNTADTDKPCAGHRIESREVTDSDDVHPATQRVYRATAIEEAEPAVDPSLAEDPEELLAELAGAEARIEELEAKLADSEDGHDWQAEAVRRRKTMSDALEALGEGYDKFDQIPGAIEALKVERDELHAEVERQRQMREQLKAELAEVRETGAEVLTTVHEAAEEGNRLQQQFNCIEQIVNEHPLGELVIESQRARHDLPQWVETFLDVAHERIEKHEMLIDAIIKALGYDDQTDTLIEWAQNVGHAITSIANNVGNTMEGGPISVVNSVKRLRDRADTLRDQNTEATDRIEQLEEQLAVARHAADELDAGKLVPADQLADPSPVIDAAWAVTLQRIASEPDRQKVSQCIHALAEALRQYHQGAANV